MIAKGKTAPIWMPAIVLLFSALTVLLCPEIGIGAPSTGVGEKHLPSNKQLSQRGINSEQLSSTLEKIGKLKGVYSVLLMEKGSLVAERYFREGRSNKPHNIKSASKSILSALIGIAIEEGKLSLNQPISEILPNFPALGDPRKKDITVRHLLTMTSGLLPASYEAYNSWTANSDWVRAALDRPLVAEPGALHQYSTGDTHILSAIITAATKMSTRAYAEKKLLDPLGITISDWDKDPQGIYIGGNNLSLLPRELIKIGQLYLNNGKFGNRQLIPKWWVYESTSGNGLGLHEVYGIYSYLWYANPGVEQAYVAVGFGGQYLFVSPRHESVIVVTSTIDSKGRKWEKELFGHIRRGVLASLQTPISIRKPSLKDEETLTIGRTTANVILRSKPGSNSIKMGQVPVGTTVTIKEKNGEWFLVQYMDKTGWLSADWVQVQPPAQPSSTRHLQLESNNKPINGITVSSDSALGLSTNHLNLRAGPGENESLILTLKPSTLLEIKEKKNGWLRVQSGKLKGWVHSPYVRFISSKYVQSEKQKPSTLLDSLDVSEMIEKKASEILNIKTAAIDIDTKKLQNAMASLSARQETIDKGQKNLTKEFELLRNDWASQLKTTVLSEIRPEHQTIRDQITSLSKSLQALDVEGKEALSNIHTLRKELKAHGSQLSTVESKNTKFALTVWEKIDVLANALTSGQGTREKLAAQIAKLGDKLAEQEKQMLQSQSSAQDTASALSDLNEQLENIDKKESINKAWHEDLYVELKSLKSDSGGEQESTNQIASRQAELESKLASVANEITVLQNTLNDSTRSRNDVSDGLAGFKDQLAAQLVELNNKLAQQDKQTLQSQSSTKDAAAKIIELGEQLANLDKSLNTQIQSIKDNSSQKKESTNQIASRQTELESNLASIANEITVLQNTLKDSTRSRNDLTDGLAGFKDQLADQLVALNNKLAQQDEKMLHSQSSTKDATAKISALGEQLANLDKNLRMGKAWQENLNIQLKSIKSSSEQKQNNTNQIIARQTELENSLASVSNEVTALQNTLKESTKGRKDATEDLAGFKEQLSAQLVKLNNKLAQQDEQMLQSQSSTQGAASQISALGEQLANLDKNLNTEIQLIKNESNQKQGSTTQIIAQQAQLESSLASVTNKVTALQNSLHESTKGRNDVTEGLAGFKEQLSAQLVKLNNKLAQQDEQMLQSQSSTQGAASQISALGEQLANLDKNLNTEIQLIKNGSSQKQGSTTQIIAQQAQLESSLASVTNKVTALQNSLHESTKGRNDVTEDLAGFKEQLSAQILELNNKLEKQNAASKISALGEQLANLDKNLNTEIQLIKNESNQKQGSTTQIIAQQAQLESSLASVTNKVTALQNSLHESTKGRNDVTEGLAGFKEQLSAQLVKLNNKLAQQDEQMLQSQSSTQGAASQISALGEQLANLDKNLNTEIQLIKNGSSQKQGSTTQIIAQQAQLESSLASVTNKVTALQNSLHESTKGRNDVTEDLAGFKEQLSAQILELNNKLEKQNAASKISALGEQLANLDKNLNTEIQLIKNESNQKQGSTTQIIAQQAQLESSLASVTNKVTALQNSLHESTKGRNDVTEGLAGFKEQLSAQIVELKTAHDQLAMEVDKKITRISSLQKDFAQLQPAADIPDKSFSELRDTISAQEQRIAFSETKNKEVDDELTKIRTHLEGLRISLEANQAKWENVNAELIKTKSDQSEKNDADQMNSQLAELEKKLGTVLENDHAEIRRQVASIQTTTNDFQLMKKDFGADLAQLFDEINLQKHEMEKQRDETQRLKQVQSELNVELIAARQKIAQLESNTSAEDIVSKTVIEPEASSPKQKIEVPTTAQDKFPQESLTTIEKTIASNMTEKMESPEQNHPDLEAVDQFVTSWANSWSRKDVDSYLSHYSELYNPPGGFSRKDWQKQRRKRLSKPSFIEVSIRNLQKKSSHDTQVFVSFTQIYKSNLFNDRVVKNLEIIWENDGWKIIKEESS